MTRPRRGSGAKTALRGPITTSTSPWRTRCHAWARADSVMPECSTATCSKRRRKRRTVCGVSAISGTRTMAWRPCSRACANARRYTSVLPLPVTPWRRNVAASPASSASHSDCTAACCGGVKVGGVSGVGRAAASAPSGSGSTRSSSSVTRPRFSRLVTGLRDTEAAASRSARTRPSGSGSRRRSTRRWAGVRSARSSTSRGASGPARTRTCRRPRPLWRTARGTMAPSASPSELP